MMSRISNYLRGISALVSDVAVCCLIVGLIPLLARWEMDAALPVWIGYLCLLFLADEIMASVGVPMNVYLLGNGAVIATGSFLVFRCSWCVPDSLDIRVLLFICAAGTGIHGAIAAYRLPGSNGLLRYVDSMIVILAFYLYAVFETGIPGNQEFVPLTLAALALDLLMVNHLRTGDESKSVIHGAGAGGKLVLALLLAGCLIVTGAVVGLASGQVHGIVDILLVIMMYLWKIAEIVFRVIGTVLGGLILLLVMFLPATPQSARQNMMDSVQESAEEVIETTGTVLPEWVLYTVLGVGAFVLAGWVMYKLRHTTFRRKLVRRNRHRIVRKSYLLPALLMLCRRIRERLVFEYAYCRSRKTPQGLLVLAERIGKQKKIGRRVHESPGEYMRRLELVLEAQQEAGRTIPEQTKAAEEGCSLSHLGELLDRIYYAGQHCRLTSEEYLGYVKKLQEVQGISDRQ